MLDKGVDFIVVGGYAVIYHGYVRATGDMDLWIRPSNGNKEKFINALGIMDMNPDDLEHIRRMDFTNTIVLHFGDPPEKIDFLTHMIGLDFDKAFERRTFINFQNYKVPVLYLDDLVINKLLSDRGKDQADVEELQKINRLKKD